jgi:hypothetical protein
MVSSLFFSNFKVEIARGEAPLDESGRDCLMEQI